MTNLYTSTPREDDRIFLYHPPTRILAELLLNAGPEGSHVLRVAAGEPVPDETFASMAAWLHRTHPLADRGLAIFSRQDLTGTLPEHIVLAGLDERNLLIHYPAFGFTAGIREDGTKIRPDWKNPDVFTPEQRSHFLHQAAENLMAAIARHSLVKRLDDEMERNSIKQITRD